MCEAKVEQKKVEYLCCSFKCILFSFLLLSSISLRLLHLIKRPTRDACLCMGELQAPAAPPAPHFVFLITL